MPFSVQFLYFTEVLPLSDVPELYYILYENQLKLPLGPNAEALGLLLGRVDICKTICNRRGDETSPTDQRGLETLKPYRLN